MRTIYRVLILVALVVMAVLPTTALAHPGSDSVQSAANGLCFLTRYTIIVHTDDAVTYGTPGDDVIVGSPGKDTIYGLGGNDLICGQGGADRIYGGDGNDRLAGEGGADKLYGEAGDDALYGGAKHDRLDGGSGYDIGADYWDGARYISIERIG